MSRKSVYWLGASGMPAAMAAAVAAAAAAAALDAAAGSVDDDDECDDAGAEEGGVPCADAAEMPAAKHSRTTGTIRIHKPSKAAGSVGSLLSGEC